MAGTVTLPTGLAVNTPASVSSAINSALALNAPINGVTNGSNALAGQIGEYLSASTTSGQTLTTNTNINAISLVLTPGDWDLSASGYFISSVGAQTFEGSLSTTSLTQGTFASGFYNYDTAAYLVQYMMPTPRVRMNVTANTTVYFVAMSTFSSGTCTVQAQINARRIR